MKKKWKQIEKNEKKNEKNEENCNFPKKWKIAIFLGFFLFIFFHFFFMFFFFSFFFLFFSICLSCFIIFASSGAKIFRKIKKCNFPRVFFIFLSCFNHFFIIFYHFSSFFYHFSSFPPPEAKNDKKMIKTWKKLEENCNFPFFGFFFAPLEEKMI